MAIDPDIVDQLGLDLGTEISTLMRRYYPDLLASAYADAGALLELDLDLDLENEFVSAVLDRLAKEVTAVAETTRDQIRGLVDQANENGWSVETLARNIRDQTEIESRRRALVVARTESASAYSQGSILAYQESGVVSGTEWLTAGDACPICDPLDGVVTDLGGEYPGGLAFPPAHPNCKCALAPVVA